MSQHSGGVAIVNGGASGIGAATVRLLAERGYAVAIWDVDEAGAKAVLADVEQADGRGLVVRVDISDHAQVTEATEQTVANLGPPTALVNCAAIRDLIPFLQLTPADWDRVIGVDLNGVFYCTQAVARVMAEHGGGAIVNVASIASTVSFPDRTAYVTAKTGVIGLTRSNAQELAPYGIRVNAVSPGTIETPLGAGIIGRPEGDTVAARTPLGRRGAPPEVANAIAFLLSPEASYITGAALAIDGGRTAIG